MDLASSVSRLASAFSARDPFCHGILKRTEFEHILQLHGGSPAQVSVLVQQFEADSGVDYSSFMRHLRMIAESESATISSAPSQDVIQHAVSVARSVSRERSAMSSPNHEAPLREERAVVDAHRHAEPRPLLNNVSPPGPSASEPQCSLSDVFAIIDTAGAGAITSVDASIAFAAHDVKVTQLEMEAILESLDVDPAKPFDRHTFCLAASRLRPTTLARIRCASTWGALSHPPVHLRSSESFSRGDHFAFQMMARVDSKLEHTKDLGAYAIGTLV